MDAEGQTGCLHLGQYLVGRSRVLKVPLAIVTEEWNVTLVATLNARRPRRSG
jgi:hypothetical protein